ncbi:MAG: hypothetical protein ACI4WG_07005 [Erysipelotrichaceae bacterium]
MVLSNILFNLRIKWIKRQGERYKREKKIRDAYAEYWPDKSKKKTSNVMLVIIVIAIVGYAIADYVLQYKFGIEISPTLTTCWFSFWGVELVALAGIKVSKVVKEPYSYEYNSSTETSQDEDAVG